MAIYTDLANKSQFDRLKQQVGVALAIECNTFLTSGTATANQLAWARTTINNINSQLDPTTDLILAANNNLTVSQIQNATDANVQTAVHAAVLGLAG